MVRIGVIFYSTYGHSWRLAEQIALGAKAGGASSVEVKRIKETLADEIVSKAGGLDVRKQWWHHPEVTPNDLLNYDGIAIGGPTRFGIVSSQLKAYLDSLGGLWARDALVGKFATVFGCSQTQHGGNETNLLSTMIPLFHLGFAISGLPYSFKGQTTDTEIVGGSPLGITSIAGSARQVSKLELEGAFFQGKHLVEVMTKYGKPRA